MNSHRYAPAFIIADLITIFGILILLCNQKYPIVGIDYRFIIPHLIDNWIFTRTSGQLIHWYTPSFGGGLPVYPNPQDFQFSIPQFLTYIFNPWIGVLASYVVLITIGFLATYHFLKSTLKFRWQAGILGAVFFSCNGFILLHATAGHLWFLVFPLLAVLIDVFFQSRIPWIVAGSIFALTVGLVIYQGGFYIMVISTLSFGIVFPLVYLIRPGIFDPKRMFKLGLSACLLTACLVGSKVFAVNSFMRFFPRLVNDENNVGAFKGILGIGLQLLGTPILGPLRWLAGRNLAGQSQFLQKWTGTPYGLWELDISVSPVMIGLFLIGVIILCQNTLTGKFYIQKNQFNLVAILALVVAVWITVEMCLAKGVLYPFFKQLPYLRSLHVNPRFASAFIFPMSILGALVGNYIVDHGLVGINNRGLFVSVNILAILPFAVYPTLPQEQLTRNSYNITEAVDIFQRIRDGYQPEINWIDATISDDQTFRYQASTLIPYDPVFGYYLEDFHPEVVEGSVRKETNGYFNMTNPAGFVFPEVNQTQPFERIKVIDADKIIKFLSYNEPNWGIPTQQKLLNTLSLATLASILTIILIYQVGKLVRFAQQGHTFHQV
ncbi:MAG: hypothetical protein PHQ40_02805 [Anaerolineaceae bacterium]|nr:hypothetical protein [Anaerolineaceae bacterium]